MTGTASILGLSAALCCVLVPTASGWQSHGETPQGAILGIEVRHLKIESNGLSVPIVFRVWDTGQVDWTRLIENEWTRWEMIGDG